MNFFITYHVTFGLGCNVRRNTSGCCCCCGGVAVAAMVILRPVLPVVLEDAVKCVVDRSWLVGTGTNDCQIDERNEFVFRFSRRGRVHSQNTKTLVEFPMLLLVRPSLTTEFR
jgi:hypothetical protein